jgi:hypothetical protein
MHITLEPFMPGGFISEWIQLMEILHPDVVKKDTEAVKLAGAVLLQHIAKVFYNAHDYPPATLYLILVGKPRTGKGAILRTVNAVAQTLGINVTGDATPEALAEELSEHPNTIQIWEDVGYIVARKQLRDKYIGLDKLLNNLYYMSPITHRRKMAKSIYLPARNYMFSFIWDTTPTEYGSVEEILGGPTGFSRRVLPIKMSDTRLQYFTYTTPDPKAATHLARMKHIAETLQNTAFLVDFTHTDITDTLRTKLEQLTIDEYEKSRINDYVNKLAALALVDRVISNYKTLPTTDIQLLTFTPVTTYVVSSNDTATLLTTYNMLTQQHTTIIADEDINRYMEATIELLQQKPAVLKREWWWSVMKGRKKRYVDEVLQTLHGLGIVNVKYIDNTTYIMHPHAKICGNCKYFNTQQCKKHVINPIEEHECFVV